MSSVPTPPGMEIFSDFDILTETYLTRSNTPVNADILLSKSLAPGSHPIILNFHGGGLVTGYSLFPPWFPRKFLPFAKRHSAVLISADYTLLPHLDGGAIVHSDLEALHTWLHNSLPSILASRAPGHTLDLSRILVNGDSAGGYVALAYALNHHSPALKALALGYPMINFDTDFWIKGAKATGTYDPDKDVQSVYQTPKAARDRMQKTLDRGVESVGGDERNGLAGKLIYHGLFLEMFNPDGKLDDDQTVWLNRRIEKGEKLPARVWLFHGDQDTTVPVDTSHIFAKEMEKQGRPIRLDVFKGKAHGFDGIDDEEYCGLKDPVLLDGLEWLAESWLQ